MSLFTPVLGIRIESCDLLYSTEWVFPERRFIEYEPKDEQWARPLGYGHENGPYSIHVQPTRTTEEILYVHPTIYEKIKQRFEARDAQR